MRETHDSTLHSMWLHMLICCNQYNFGLLRAQLLPRHHMGKEVWAAANWYMLANVCFTVIAKHTSHIGQGSVVPLSAGTKRKPLSPPPPPPHVGQGSFGKLPKEPLSRTRPLLTDYFGPVPKEHIFPTFSDQ